MSIVIGIVALAVLRAGGFSLPHHRHDRYGLRLGLGILLILRRATRVPPQTEPPDPDQPQKGIVSRLMATPAPYTAFLAGILVFAPGVTFIAAVQVVATANADLSETAAAPDRDRGHQRLARLAAPVLLPCCAGASPPGGWAAFNGWLRRNGRPSSLVRWWPPGLS